jgi:plasmid stabilization system protein ParE
MDWEVAWTEPAVADFEAAVRSAARQSEASAESLRDALVQSVGMLAKFPEIGPVYERDRSGRTRDVVCRQYRIFYRLAESERRVEVLVVWHSSRPVSRGCPGSISR